MQTCPCSAGGVGTGKKLSMEMTESSGVSTTSLAGSWAGFGATDVPPVQTNSPFTHSHSLLSSLYSIGIVVVVVVVVVVGNGSEESIGTVSVVR